MNQVTGRPLHYQAGLDFDYDVWAQGSIVTMCNVPWDSTYLNTVKFPTKQARDAYITSSSGKIVMDRVTYLRTGEPVRVPVPYSQAMKFNYLRVENPAQPIPGDEPTVFYYFIREATHINPGTTALHVQLDIWQTYLYDTEINHGYLERGHYALVQGQESFTNEWLTTPEAIDTGSDYVTGRSIDKPITGSQFDVLVTTVTNFEADPGVDTNPKQNTAGGTQVNGMPTALQSYIVHGEHLAAFMNGMSVFSWIARGIIRCVIVPRIAGTLENVERKTYGDAALSYTFPPGPSGGTASYLYRLNVNVVGAFTMPTYNYVDHVEEHPSFTNSPYRWMNKLKCAPYSQINISDSAGQVIALSPQLMQNPEAQVFFTRFSAYPAGEQLRIIPSGYASYGNVNNVDEYALIIQDFPVVPTVNDNAAIALASQAHGLAQARDAAQWGQQRAMAANQNSYDNTSIGLGAAADSSAIGRNQDINSTYAQNDTSREQARLGVATNVGGSVIGGGLGGAAGAAAGAVAGAGASVVQALQTNIQVASNNTQLGIRNNANAAIAGIAMGSGSAIRDNNKSLADWAARGDYANAIAAIDASVQDTKMTPASMAGQSGGQLGAWALQRYNVCIYVKSISRDVLSRVGAYFARYGYAANRFISVNNQLTLMKYQTYWKMQQVHITAPNGMSETFINALRGIFEKGVTVWDDPNEIRNLHIADNTIKESN